jgi:catechol 2,3-dioxygenase-like lactoylglutathione lyase family enzyme
MQKKKITGIQQIGIGVSNVQEAWKWYREHFGVDIRIFEEEAIADLMLPYTGGKPQSRYAALAINLQGGGGFEIWQYTQRVPQPANFEIRMGDLGIFAIKIKSQNVKATYEWFRKRETKTMPLVKDPSGTDSFYLKDPYGNVFQVVEGKGWFRRENKLTGGVFGATIGVSNIDHSMKVYAEILGYDEIVYDETRVFEDFQGLGGSKNQYRRVLLQHSEERTGGFSRLFGPSMIELIQVMDREPAKIFANRYWGDLGFIHLCFDINGMEILKKECEDKGFPFTVDSFANHNGNSFDMGEAAGHFSYIEDPDGTLIEFVETHRVPIIKKLGWYFNMQKRNPNKNLPNWMVKSLRFNRIKDKKQKSA